jgi:hypothetical protein
VLRAYCDESYDSKDRVYAVAGFVGKDRDWKSISRNWRNRCLKDGVECYHATDCESQVKDFKNFTVSQSIRLNTDLVADLAGARIAGFGIGVLLEDYKAVAESSPKAKRFLSQSPYFLAFQFLVVELCAEVSQWRPSPVAFVFEQQDEFSGQAKRMYGDVKAKNPLTAPCMGSLTYGDKEKFVPLQLADKLAYEVMKNLLNTKYDVNRAERKSLLKMKEMRIVKTIKYLDYYAIDLIVKAQPDA